MNAWTRLACVLCVLAARTTLPAEELPLVVADDFEDGMARWETTDPDASRPFWKIEEVLRNGHAERVLRVLGPSNYEPPHRSPHSIALVRDLVVGDFELSVDVQNTRPDAGPHRDLCLFWGFQDSSHFYYVHFGAKADPHACQIFIVNNAPRTMITEKLAEGTPWTDGWHKVRLVRDVNSGTMEVFFDDMTKPQMTARDTTFQWGQVGLGTFDDHGNFDNFELRGVRVERR